MISISYSSCITIPCSKHMITNSCRRSELIGDCWHITTTRVNEGLAIKSHGWKYGSYLWSAFYWLTWRCWIMRRNNHLNGLNEMCRCNWEFSSFTQLYFKSFNTLRPRQNVRHFADDILKRIFVNEDVRISIWISLKFVPKGPIDNIPVLVQITAWRRPV